MILLDKTEQQSGTRAMPLAIAAVGAVLVAGCFAIAYALSLQSF